MCSAVGTVDALATVAEPRPGSSTRVISLSLGDGRAARNQDCTDHVLRFAYASGSSLHGLDALDLLVTVGEILDIAGGQVMP
jgi:hypothetical protein